MNLQDIAEVAAYVGWYGFDYEMSSLEPIDSLSEYWKSTKYLFRAWERELSTKSHVSTEFAEEIIVAELLTRTIAAKLIFESRQFQKPRWGTAAHQSIKDHQRIYQKLMRSNEFMLSQRLDVEKKARKMQRWTDLLISSFASERMCLSAAFDRERCLEFAEDWHESTVQLKDFITFQLQVASLRMEVPQQIIVSPTRTGAHQLRCEHATAMIGCITRTPVAKAKSSTVKDAIQAVRAVNLN